MRVKSYLSAETVIRVVVILMLILQGVPTEHLLLFPLPSPRYFPDFFISIYIKRFELHFK